MRHAISQTLPLADRVYTVEPLDNPRAMPSDELAALAGEYCADVRSWGKELDGAFADAYDSLSPEDTLLVCGRSMWRPISVTPPGGSLKAGESAQPASLSCPREFFPLSETDSLFILNPLSFGIEDFLLHFLRKDGSYGCHAGSNK